MLCGASHRVALLSLIGVKYNTPIETPKTPTEGRAALPGRAAPLPLGPDPAAVCEAAVRSLVRAVLATGLNGLNHSVPPNRLRPPDVAI